MIIRPDSRFNSISLISKNAWTSFDLFCLWSPKGKLSSYISSVASENIKNFENSNEDNSLEDMQKKLQML